MGDIEHGPEACLSSEPHADTRHPLGKLQGIIDMARGLVRAIRRFFPVEGTPWEFAGSPNRLGLISAVGKWLYNLESSLNPKRCPFTDPDRSDPLRIAGTRGMSLYMRPDLYEGIANLVRRFDAVLEHYQVEEEVSEQKDPSMLWWHWDIDEIEPELRERLDGAAGCLEEVLGEVDCQVFPDLWRPKGAPSILSEDDSDQPSPGHPPKTLGEANPSAADEIGFLGIVLDEQRLEVRRVGYDPVRFSGGGILWRLLKALVRKKDHWYAKKDLARDVWVTEDEPLRDCAYDNAVEKQLSLLRKKLEPVGIGIKTAKRLGSKLVALSAPDRV